MSLIDCIADRFVRTGRELAIDLASGNHVRLVVSPSGEAAQQLAWAARCDVAYAEAGDGTSALVDYGLCGPSHRFEAWGTKGAGVGNARLELAVTELFEVDRERAHVLRLFGPPRSGKSAALARLARIARLRGFVPFAVQLLQSPLASVLDGRSVFLIDDGRGAGLRVLLDVLLRSPRPHVLIQAAVEDAPGLPNICLSRSSPRRTHVSVITRAAERAPVYGASAPASAWPVPGDVLSLRQQIDEGVRRLDEGRHAAGERALRQAVGGLMRRGEWGSAADGSITLASSLLRRGRARDAKALLDGARESCRKAPGDLLLIRASALSGVALVDLGRLDEAETVLAAAQTVAVHADDGRSLPPVALALARCRFWRGRYADAWDALRLLRDRELTDIERVRVDVMRARLAVADDDLAAATQFSADATARAGSMGKLVARAEAACGAAFVRLAAGDLAALRHDCAACIAAARTSRDPLRQLRAELILCEMLRRGGLRDEALRVFARARRIPSSSLPRCRTRSAASCPSPGKVASDS